MADNKKYTNRLMDKVTKDTYFVYDEEALHDNSNISRLTNDANYVRRQDVDTAVSEALASNEEYAKKTDLEAATADFITSEALEGLVHEDELANLNVASKDVIELAEADLSDMSLADIEKDTHYHIAEALNAPAGTASLGTLSVMKLNDGLFYQEWLTSTGKAYRMVTKGMEDVLQWGDDFTIEGLSRGSSYSYGAYSDTIWLKPGGTFLIHGYVNKKVVVGIKPTEEVPDSYGTTLIILDGALLKPEGEETAIDYQMPEGSLVINVKGENAIIIDGTSVAELSELNTHGLRSTAAIQSESKVFIGGTGSLSISSDALNHGIKAGDISIKDHIHLYIDLHNGHDALHIGENDRILISDGVFTFKNCRDAIDCDRNSIVEILGGDLTFEGNTKDIDCSAEGAKGRVFNMLGKTVLTSDKNIFDNVQTITPENIASVYGEGRVTSLDGVTVFTPDADGVYSVGATEVLVSGYFANNQIVLTSEESVDVYLRDAYISNNMPRASSKKCHTLWYNNKEAKKMAVRLEPGTTNFVYQTQSEATTKDGYGAIKSKENLTIQGAGSLFAISTLSDAADGANVIIKGDGYRYFESKAEGKEGITGKLVVIGEEDKVIHDPAGEMDDQTEPGEPSYQTIYTTSLRADKNGNGEKGTITVLANQYGYVISETEPIAAAGLEVKYLGWENKYGMHIGLEDTYGYKKIHLAEEAYAVYEIDDETRFSNERRRMIVKPTAGWKVFTLTGDPNDSAILDMSSLRHLTYGETSIPDGMSDWMKYPSDGTSFQKETILIVADDKPFVVTAYIGVTNGGQDLCEGVIVTPFGHILFSSDSKSLGTTLDWSNFVNPFGGASSGSSSIVLYYGENNIDDINSMALGDIAKAQGIGVAIPLRILFLSESQPEPEMPGGPILGGPSKPLLSEPTPGLATFTGLYTGTNVNGNTYTGTIDTPYGQIIVVSEYNDGSEHYSHTFDWSGVKNPFGSSEILDRDAAKVFSYGETSIRGIGASDWMKYPSDGTRQKETIVILTGMNNPSVMTAYIGVDEGNEKNCRGTIFTPFGVIPFSADSRKTTLIWSNFINPLGGASIGLYYDTNDVDDDSPMLLGDIVRVEGRDVPIPLRISFSNNSAPVEEGGGGLLEAPALSAPVLSDEPSMPRPASNIVSFIGLYTKVDELNDTCVGIIETPYGHIAVKSRFRRGESIGDYSYLYTFDWSEVKNPFGETESPIVLYYNEDTINREDANRLGKIADEQNTEGTSIPLRVYFLGKPQAEEGGGLLEASLSLKATPGLATFVGSYSYCYYSNNYRYGYINTPYGQIVVRSRYVHGEDSDYYNVTFDWSGVANPFASASDSSIGDIGAVLDAINGEEV